MKCTVCDFENKDGAKFCGKCGVPLVLPETEQQMPEQVTEQAPEQVVRQAAEQAPKKPPFDFKSLLTPGKIAIAAAAVAVLVVACNYKAAANAACRLFMSPEKYLARVVTQNGRDVVNAVGDCYGEYVLDGILDKKATVSGSIELGDSAREMLADEVKDLDFLKSVAYEISAGTSDKGVSGDIALKLNGQSVLSANAALVVKDECAYLQVPELSGKYLTIDVSEQTIPGYGDESVCAMYSKAMKVAKDVLKSAPSASTVDKIANRYLETAAGELQNVKKGDKLLKVNDITQKCVSLRGEITDLDLLRMKAAIMKKVLTDRQLRSVVKDLYEASARAYLEFEPDREMDTFVQFYADFLNDLRDEYDYLMDDIEAFDPEDAEKLLTYRIYVNKQGQIAGFDVEFDDGYTYTISMAYPQKGNKVGMDIYFAEGRNGAVRDSFELKGVGKLSGSRVSGDFDLKVSGNSICRISTKSVDVGRLMKGEFKGTFTATDFNEQAVSLLRSYLPSSLARNSGDLAVIIDIDATNTSGKTAWTIELASEKFLKIEGSYSISNSSGVSSPSASKQVLVEDESDMQEYCDSVSSVKIISALTKANVPDKYVDMVEDYIDALADGNYGALASLIPGSLYPDNYYDWEYDDWEDDDWYDDWEDDDWYDDWEDDDQYDDWDYDYED